MIVSQKDYNHIMNNQLTLSITKYEGYEKDILTILDRNRSFKHTTSYLNWRYSNEGNSRPPLFFWLRLPSGKAVGIASLICRPYWVDNHKNPIWILGDIALDEEFRGKGYGQKLFRFVNSYIEKSCPGFAFVIPTESAHKALLASGWSRALPLSLMVWAFDPVIKIFPNIGGNWVFKFFRVCYRKLLLMLFSKHIRGGFKIELSSFFDNDFNEFWKLVDKKRLIIRDRSKTSLLYRFKQCPDKLFQIHKIYYLNKLVGYIISNNSNGLCQIVDFLPLKVRFIRPMFALFLKKMNEDLNVHMVRLRINSDCIYFSELKKLGFMQRDRKGVFQFYSPKKNEEIGRMNWFITSADKLT
jgi:GNAT superfamily N-acetyltransferase